MILTYAWDCLLIDPLPGPRRSAHFTDLEIGATLTTWLTEPCSAAKMRTMGSPGEQYQHARA
ncbi:hypothetical protein ACFY20_36225 [Streptomyces sp. NPDC001312]|uniref:hypothetical protein n=1 Tax=Streptomyces sp. NPDC001312 TaxID=3364561 RepID=UPI0036A1B304